MDIINNPVVQFIVTLYAAHPLLTIFAGIVSIIVLPEILVLLFVAFLVTAFGQQITAFIKTAFKGNNPWQQ